MDENYENLSRQEIIGEMVRMKDTINDLRRSIEMGYNDRRSLENRIKDACMTYAMDGTDIHCINRFLAEIGLDRLESALTITVCVEDIFPDQFDETALTDELIDFFGKSISVDCEWE